MTVIVASRTARSSCLPPLWRKQKGEEEATILQRGVIVLSWRSHSESTRLLWNSRLPLIYGLKKALVPAHLDERGPFRGSKTAEVPLITFLPRLFCRPREQAIGCVLETVRENSWLPSRRSQARRTPFLLQSTYWRISISFKSPSIHPTVTVGSCHSYLALSKALLHSGNSSVMLITTWGGR